MSGSILYSAVLRNKEFVADAQANQSLPIDPRRVVEAIVNKMGSQDSQQSFKHEGFMFNLRQKYGVCYVCVNDPKFPARTSFSFLQQIENHFTKGSEFGFEQILRREMKSFSEKPDQLQQLNSQVGEVEGLMKQNVTKLLDREDNLNQVVERTEMLNENAKRFQGSATKLKNTFWWKNVKLWFLIIGIVLAVIFIIIWRMFCFINV